MRNPPTSQGLIVGKTACAVDARLRAECESTSKKTVRKRTVFLFLFYARFAVEILCEVPSCPEEILAIRPGREEKRTRGFFRRLEIFRERNHELIGR